VSDDPLDAINRFVISTVALVAIFAALAVVLLAWGATDGTIGQVEDFAGYLRDHDERDAKIVVSLLALVTVLLMATVILIELTPSPMQRMRLRTVKAGDASLTTVQIAGRIEDEVSAIEHIASCKATVAARGNRVEIVLDLNVDAGADLARTADEACGRAHTLVEQQMGVPLAQRPRARMHYRELKLAAAPHDAPPRPSTGWERPGDEGAPTP
jgi:hypothetical protein